MPKRREIAISAYDETQLRKFRALCDREHRNHAQFVKVRPAFGLWLANYALGRVPKLSVDHQIIEAEQREREKREHALSYDLWSKKFYLPVQPMASGHYCDWAGIPCTCAESPLPGPLKQKAPRKAHNSKKAER